MRRHWRRVTIALVFGTTIAAIGSSGCIVRAKAGVTATVVDEDPPPPRHVVVRERAGHVWVKGRWVMRGGRWVWNDGRWVVERRGQRWEDGRWVRRGDRWHWVDGRWAVVSGGVVVHDADDHDGGGAYVEAEAEGSAEIEVSGDYPVEAPPAPRVEDVAPRQGYIWIAGHWEWKGSRWNWLAGRWERPRAKKVWRGGRWERRGRHYIWIEGQWVVR